MTTSRPARPSARRARPEDGWQASWPELTIAAILVIAVAAAAYAWAGVAAAVLSLCCAAFLALALLRSLPPVEVQPEPRADEWDDRGHTSITGFWRKRGVVKDATASMASYEHELRPTLQRLLATRLAERHDISLFADPDAARLLLLPRQRDQHLWAWLDPRQPPESDQGRGIPPRTLAAIINRMERL